MLDLVLEDGRALLREASSEGSRSSNDHDEDGHKTKVSLTPPRHDRDLEQWGWLLMKMVAVFLVVTDGLSSWPRMAMAPLCRRRSSLVIEIDRRRDELRS